MGILLCRTHAAADDYELWTVDQDDAERMAEFFSTEWHEHPTWLGFCFEVRVSGDTLAAIDMRDHDAWQLLGISRWAREYFGRPESQAKLLAMVEQMLRSVTAALEMQRDLHQLVLTTTLDLKARMEEFKR